MENNAFLEEFQKILNPVSRHQGDIKTLRELFDQRLELYNMTPNAAETLLEMEKRTLEGIIDKSTKKVDVINLLKLAQFLGLDGAQMMNAFIREATPDTANELQQTRRNCYLVANFDLKTLVKMGFIKSRNDFDDIEERIKRFFQLDSIYDYTSKHYLPAFSKTKRSGNQVMQEFWVRSAHTYFDKIDNPHSYDRSGLVELIPKIKPYSMNVENGLKIVTQALYNLGVTVLYQPSLPLTQIRGATFIVTGKPCIALTNHNKNYATVWFALLHELYHVLYDFEEVEKQVFHLTGESDLFLLEDAANEFAAEYFVPLQKLKFISTHINNPYLVSQFAHENQIHPSILYNRYCYFMESKGKGSYWARYKSHSLSSEVAFKDLNMHLFDIDSIDESVTYLKEKVFNI